MMEILNEGKGRCHGTASLLIKPVKAVITLGASDDVLTGTLNAVHHANRHGSIDDFIAVALPAMHKGRDCMLPGHDIELIGSEASLSGLINLDWIQVLVERGMLMSFEIKETDLETGETGAAYVRDRDFEKRTRGWFRRNKSRAIRREKIWKEKDIPVSLDARTNLCIRYKKTIINLRQIIGKITDDTLIVGTYGFSSPVSGTQAILPVYPDMARNELVQEYDNAI